MSLTSSKGGRSPLTSPDPSKKTRQRRPTTKICHCLRTDGEPCRNPVKPGLEVCGFHGGNTPAAKAKAARVVREQKAREAMVKFGRPVEVDAVTALTQELHRSAGMVEWVGRQLGMVPKSHSGLVAPVSIFNAAVTNEELGDGPALMVREETEAGFRFVENPLIAIYREERKHLAAVATTCVKLGLKQIEVEAFVQAARAEAAGVVELLRELVAAPELAGMTDTVTAVVRRLLAERASRSLPA